MKLSAALALCGALSSQLACDSSTTRAVGPTDAARDGAVQTTDAAADQTSSDAPGRCCDTASSDTAVDAARPDAGSSSDASQPGDGGGVQPAGTAAQIAATCAKLLGCSATLQVLNTVNSCISKAYARGDALAARYVPCLANGTAGCTDVATCTGRAFSSGSCSTFTSTCNGDKLEVCLPSSPPLAEALDCRRLFGSGCITFSSGEAGCSSGTTCTASGWFCKGNYVAWCYSGNEFLESDCTRLGLTCRTDRCAGPDEACSGTTAKCEGSDTIAFCIGHHRMRVSCSGLGAGFSCRTAPSGGASCSQGTQCSASTTPSCSGSKLTICNGGKSAQIDCKALGFSGCSAGNCTP